MTTASLSAVVHYVRRLGEGDLRGLTDRELLDRFTGERSEAAFAELVRRHGPAVLSACKRVLSNEHDAEDAFQAAFLVLVRKAGSIRKHEAVGGWLYQVAYRLALRVRTLSDRQSSEPLSEEVPAPIRPSDLLRTSLDEELARLPEPYRTAIVLCYLEGRTQAEAARLLATTADGINSRLKRGRDLLRQRLVRRGLVLSGTALVAALAAGRAARAALSPALVQHSTRAALNFVTDPAGCGASFLATALAKGALQAMTTLKYRFLVLPALTLAVALLAASALLVPPPALGTNPARDAGTELQPAAPDKPAVPADGKGKPQFSVILLWMSGGVSQIDTFDPKPGDPNGGPFKPINTSVKGLQFTELLPRLAKQADHLAIIRSVTHQEGDHGRGTFLMRTGYAEDGMTDYPSLACVLAKELGDGRPDLPLHISVAPFKFISPSAYGSGYLGSAYAPLVVAERGASGGANVGLDEALRLPAAEAFDALVKGQGEKHRKAVAKAFDLGEEKKEVRDAYGRTLFGQGCLLARRLVEQGVPVVEVTLPGWDTHANSRDLLPKRGAELDAAWAALLKDLQERKRLETTLVVCMTEFGRTPRINANDGRDHWPMGFSVVLAGGGIKGGQVIGKTSADGVKVEEGPVTPPELLATIYQAVGIDPTKTHKANTGQQVPLVEKGARPVKEALR